MMLTLGLSVTTVAAVGGALTSGLDDVPVLPLVDLDLIDFTGAPTLSTPGQTSSAIAGGWSLAQASDFGTGGAVAWAIPGGLTAGYEYRMTMDLEATVGDLSSRFISFRTASDAALGADLGADIDSVPFSSGVSTRRADANFQGAATDAYFGAVFEDGSVAEANTIEATGLSLVLNSLAAFQSQDAPPQTFTSTAGNPWWTGDGWALKKANNDASASSWVVSISHLPVGAQVKLIADVEFTAIAASSYTWAARVAQDSALTADVREQVFASSDKVVGDTASIDFDFTRGENDAWLGIYFDTDAAGDAIRLSNIRLVSQAEVGTPAVPARTLIYFNDFNQAPDIEGFVNTTTGDAGELTYDATDEALNFANQTTGWQPYATPVLPCETGASYRIEWYCKNNAARDFDFGAGQSHASPSDYFGLNNGFGIRLVDYETEIVSRTFTATADTLVGSWRSRGNSFGEPGFDILSMTVTKL